MDELEFILSCVKGDKQSWDKFVDKYSRLIYNYIYNILSTKGYTFSQQHIHDIFQEIFYSLIKDNFKKLKSFKGRNGCSLASWLRQVTVNLTIDYMRKFKPAVSLDEERDEEFSLKDILADDSPAVRDTLHYRERLENLKDCISDLDSSDKYFIQLHINRGVKLEALRGVLHLSRGAIDMQKLRIVQRLRDCFKNKGFALD